MEQTVSSTEYDERSVQRNAEYQRAYEEWVHGLPPEDRQKIREQGLAEPMLNPFRLHSLPVKDNDADPGDILEAIEPEEMDPQELDRLSRFNPEMLRTVLGLLFFPTTGKITLHSALHRLVALGHCLHVPGIGDRSLASLAEELGVTRSLLTHYVVRIRDAGGLDHQAGQSDASRAATSERMRAFWKLKPQKQRQRVQNAAPSSQIEDSGEQDTTRLRGS